MLTILVRAVILFAAAVAAMRLMGKRQVGQLQPYEMVVVIMIADLAATPMGGANVPLLYGLVPLAALAACHGLISAACMKNRRLRRLLCGEPTVLVRRGALCEQAMRRVCITIDDLTEAMRIGGIVDLGQVETAVLETSGVISVFPTAQARPVTPEDLKLTPPREGLPLPLIVDGEIQRHNLTRGKWDEEWLTAQLRSLGFASAREVLFLCVTTGGQLLAQGRGRDEMRQAQVFAPGEAVW